MPKEFRQAQNEFYSILSGKETATPRWRTCASETNVKFEYATALLYAHRYRTDEGKKWVSLLYE